MDQPIEQYIDHTLLNPAATREQITQLCAEAREHNFYAVCVNPYHIRQAREELKGTSVLIAAPVGFPLGTNLSSIKAAEAKAAVNDGAREIDMVMNIGALKSGDSDFVINDIREVIRASAGCPVKVIIECDLLTDDEKATAATICMQAGVAMVKTCTGFVKNGKGATVEDVRLIKDVLADSGLGIKASGGICDYASAKALIEAGATRIGTSSGVAIVAAAQSAI